MSATIRYRRTAERPDFLIWWLDRNSSLIDFSSGYTFELKIGQIGGAAILTKTVGITGAAGSGVEPTGTPNITVAWSAGELDLTPGYYDLVLTANTASTDRVFARTLRIDDVIT